MTIKTLRIIILLIGTPVVLSSYNLSLIYKINTLKKEIKNIEIENNYRKKELYKVSSPKKIIKEAELLGFKTPEPYTIITVNEKKEIKNNDKNKFLVKTPFFKKHRNI